MLLLIRFILDIIKWKEQTKNITTTKNKKQKYKNETKTKQTQNKNKNKTKQTNKQPKTQKQYITIGTMLCG